MRVAMGSLVHGNLFLSGKWGSPDQPTHRTLKTASVTQATDNEDKTSAGFLSAEKMVANPGTSKPLFNYM